MKYLFTLLSVLAVTIFASAQSSKQVKWVFTAKKIADKTFEVNMTATINGNWHMYAQNVGVEGPLPTTFTFTKNPLTVIDGKPKEIGKVIKKREEIFGGVVNYFEKTVSYVQVVKVKGNIKTALVGKVEFLVCSDNTCLPPSEVEFSVNVGG
ncbi:MAG: protein-disulfide reductase DsbD domain-containing protein [Chitinophagaceae bacterium]